jgi:hypothetical protein
MLPVCIFVVIFIVESSVKAEVTPYHYKLDRLLGIQEVEFPEFLDSRHMKVESLSAVCTGRHYPEGDTPGTDFC